MRNTKSHEAPPAGTPMREFRPLFDLATELRERLQGVSHRLAGIDCTISPGAPSGDSCPNAGDHCVETVLSDALVYAQDIENRTATIEAKVGHAG